MTVLPKRKTPARGLAVVAALAFAFCAATASARVLRQPETGDPALEVEIPDDWIASKDKSANLIVRSADSSAAFALNVLTNSRPLDVLARAVFAAQKISQVPDSRPGSIAGHAGLSYDWTVATPGKSTVHMTLTLVQIDPTHVANATKVLADISSAETRQIANWIAQDLRIAAASH